MGAMIVQLLRTRKARFLSNAGFDGPCFVVEKQQFFGVDTVCKYLCYSHKRRIEKPEEMPSKWRKHVYSIPNTTGVLEPQQDR